ETAMARYFADLFTERNRWADAATIVEQFRALAAPDPEWLYDGVKAPALMITGSEDTAHAGAFGLQERLPDCELVTMQGAGHACNSERPWEWDAIALDSLRRRGRLEGAGSAAPATAS